MKLAVVLCIGCASALQLSTTATCPRVQRRAVQPKCVATTDDEKAVVAASQKVTMAAKKFGVTQGKAAQAWVESAIKTSDVSGSTLMQMQLQLFDECKLDDESGRCKDMSDAIEALTAAVAERKNAPKDEEFKLVMGPTPIQEAATKLRAAATSFGPEQKTAADAWIKKLASGQVPPGTRSPFSRSLRSQSVSQPASTPAPMSAALLPCFDPMLTPVPASLLLAAGRRRTASGCSRSR